MPTTEYRFYMSVTSFCRKKTSFSALVSSRMAGVTLVLMASLMLHATQAPYAKAGHFWDEVGSDFHGDRLMFTDAYVEIMLKSQHCRTLWLVSGDLCLLSARQRGIASSWVCWQPPCSRSF